MTQPRAPQTGEIIRRLRRAAGLSQEELAERLGVSRQSVSLWEQGNTQPSLENLRAMTEILHTDFNTLLGGAVVPTEDAAEDASGEPIPTEVIPPPPPTGDPLHIERRALQKSMDFRASLSTQFFLLPLWLFLGLIGAAAVSDITGYISDDMGGLLVLIILIGSILSVVFGIRQRRSLRRLRRRMAKLPPTPATKPTTETAPAPEPISESENPPAPSPRPSRTTGNYLRLSVATGLLVWAVISWLAALLLMGSHAWDSILPFLTGMILLVVSVLLLWIDRLIHLLRKRHTTPQPLRRTRPVRVLTLVGLGLLVCFFLLRGIALLGLSFVPTLYLYLAALLCLLASDIVMLVDGWRDEYS